MPQYIKVIRKSKFNTRIELPDHSTQLIPTGDLDKWEYTPLPESDNKPKIVREKKKPSYKAGLFHRNSNGLGNDHPYMTVNMNYNTEIYEEGIDVPF